MDRARVIGANVLCVEQFLKTMIVPEKTTHIHQLYAHTGTDHPEKIFLHSLLKNDCAILVGRLRPLLYPNLVILLFYHHTLDD
jgi:hypothetical protein